jgi:hypothetical protein
MFEFFLNNNQTMVHTPMARTLTKNCNAPKKSTPRVSVCCFFPGDGARIFDVDVVKLSSWQFYLDVLGPDVIQETFRSTADPDVLFSVFLGTSVNGTSKPCELFNVFLKHHCSQATVDVYTQKRRTRAIVVCVDNRGVVTDFPVECLTSAACSFQHCLVIADCVYDNLYKCSYSRKMDLNGLVLYTSIGLHQNELNQEEQTLTITRHFQHDGVTQKFFLYRASDYKHFFMSSLLESDISIGKEKVCN